jgi:hypothetical protein
MFRCSTILRELVWSLAKVTILHSTQHTRHSQDMLPQHHISYKDKIYYNVTLARLRTSSLRMVEDRNM